MENIISIRYFKWGYWVIDRWHDNGDIDMKSAYNENGDYIGNPKDAYYLCKKRGINPEVRTRKSAVCSIGYSKKDKKWYGWSHRAIYGFKIGSKCKKGNCHYTPKRGEWTAKTIADAKQMAKDFAEGVS